MAQEPTSIKTPALKDLSIKIIHDNNAYLDSLKTAWGFSALVTGPNETILFDTGSDGALLLDNMAGLQVGPGSIDTVVLSHVHPDHTGGLVGLLTRNPAVAVHLPKPFPATLKEVVRGYGAAVIEVDEPQELCENVYTTGPMGRRIKEQAVIVRTDRGLIVLTGCAHPGVAKMLDSVRSLHEEGILLVMGGFHLEWAFKRKIEKTIDLFEHHGVRHVAPTHCSGDKARQLFQRRFGRHYVEVGVGKTVTLADLK
jgi:7,8-dihydropterin-6-yl-methyl-4-(beta-D-ribofuranosyl)aminobenzene 5'-phosphate synthase